MSALRHPVLSENSDAAARRPICHACGIEMVYLHTYPAPNDPAIDEHIYRCEVCKRKQSQFERRV
jgi:predicted RNA-binding Zn-ribbon protein involved in translation (DUF1610 family)